MLLAAHRHNWCPSINGYFPQSLRQIRILILEILQCIPVVKILIFRDLCKTPPFAQSLRQAQILILEIFYIFLRLKLSPSLTLTKIEHFSKVSFLDLEKTISFLDGH